MIDSIVKIAPAKLRLKQRFLLVAVIFLIVLASGCVYLRLLQVKRQLSDFNTNFQIKDENGLTLVFLKPVLLAADIIWLMNAPPKSKVKVGSGEHWKYVFEKQYPVEKNEEGNFDIPISMVFEGDKLGQMIFPERFLKYVSKPLLVKMMKSIGEAEIDKSKKRAGSSFRARDTLEIPRKRQVVEVLGLPFDSQDSDKNSIFIYKYNLREESTRPSGGEFKLVMGFKFQKEDDRLLKAETDLNGLKMSINFSFIQTDDDGEVGKDK